MKILHYDCFAGISGDMNLGAMIDLGVDANYLIAQLEKLKLEGYELRISRQQRRGITGTQCEVILTGNQHDEDHHHHDHHSHGVFANVFDGLKRRIIPEYYQELEHENGGGHHHHRNLGDIEAIIRGSDLPDKVQEMSMKIFEIIAHAEAKIHGKPIDAVHFHEVGAVDSIVDIVGAAICIDYLKPDRIIASPVEMGGGFVDCAHGRFPVPAPATLEIMQGHPMKFGAVPFETATPTGVAILAALANEFTDRSAFSISKVGYGIGHRDTEIPNVLRVCLGEVAEQQQLLPNTEDAVVVECNIDDMNPERYGYVMERLFEIGADDVYLHNLVMKKSRPATMISALCTPDTLHAVAHLLFTETSTLGLRYYHVKKSMLTRNTRTIDTPWGAVHMKDAFYEGSKLKTKPEYDDCVFIARKYGVRIETVYQQIAQTDA